MARNSRSTLARDAAVQVLKCDDEVVVAAHLHAQDVEVRFGPPESSDRRRLLTIQERDFELVDAGLLLPSSDCGKHDVSRALEAAPSVVKDQQSRLLDAA